mgnify:CR=1 FL=1
METENKLSTAKVAEEMGLILPKNMGDTIYNTLTRYERNGAIDIPAGYSVGNALKTAWLKIQDDEKLMACTDASKANAMLQMCVLGLDVSKSQAYLIPYGNKCTLMPSYFGKQVMVMRIHGVKNIVSGILYKDTDYNLTVDEFGNDIINILKPCPLEKRVPENISGAWCKIILDKEVFGMSEFDCIMNKKQIDKAFSKAKTKNVQNDFPEEMSKRTVINRCVKNFVNTRTDQDVYEHDEEENKTFNEAIKPQTIDVEVEPEEQPIDIDSFSDIDEVNQ